MRRHRIQRNWRQQDLADQLGTSRITVHRWEQGSQQPSAYYRVKLCALFGLSAQELGLVEESPPLAENLPPSESLASKRRLSDVLPTEIDALWTVPYARNPHFTGRDELLDQIMQVFSPHISRQPSGLCQAVLTQAQALRGLGGVGKTQIAAEYAYRSRAQGRYTHTLWMNAASEEALLASFIKVVDLLPALRSSGETDQCTLVAQVLRWLERCPQPWLLILDNADDLSFLQPYLPQWGNGDILLTTRVHAVGSLSSSSIEVDTMGMMEGIQLLLRRAQRFTYATDSEINEAGNLVIELGSLPLALDQAGAYIEETGCSVHDYLQLYRQHRHALLAQRGKQATGYPESVATTWSLSFQRIAQTNPAAVELLRLCAFLPPDHIPEELLIDGASYWPSLLQQAVADRFSFDQMLSTLLAFSLVKRLTQDKMLSLHRLIQVVQMETMGREEQHRWAERLVHALSALFPHDPTDPIASWPQCQRYLAQVQACETFIEEHQLLFPEAADLLDRTGTYLRECGSYSLAELLYQRALHIYKQLWGSTHLQVAAELSHLAALYYQQGKYEQAEHLYQCTLHMWEQLQGLSHPNIAISLNGLANLYREQGKYEQAEPLYLQALHILEQQVSSPMIDPAHISRARRNGTVVQPSPRRILPIHNLQKTAEHPEVATLLNNLAYLYIEQGKYGQAELLYQRALHIRERQLGPEHLLVAYSLYGMANLYREQGKYGQAELLYQRALHIREHQLGPEHVLVAYPLNELAILYSEQGKYEEAEPLYQRALHIWEQQLGSGHSQVASPLTGLANLYREQGKYEQAEALYQRALHIREHQRGPEHSQIAYPLAGLANLYREQGKYEQAEALYQRVLHIQQQWGPEHAKTASVLHDFAILQQAQGKTAEAEALYQRALTIREHILGPDHPLTINTRERLYSM
ncbi:tetratricopeptide repeat protein [Ktedonospora formicarum]|uniref:Tetratricopeptide repeat protein n=1 Tax=Ktedonospora formicarum TaxID=2778364 RepID=A0A8J3IBM6_9CHLR|nr:tetratricopeptide repeat protein [Ktedonospora formicarum]GHO49702.1 tetratricopeptide repeat protein [Ktedonospora formicarum]